MRDASRNMVKHLEDQTLWVGYFKVYKSQILSLEAIDEVDHTVFSKIIYSEPSQTEVGV